MADYISRDELFKAIDNCRIKASNDEILAGANVALKAVKEIIRVKISAADVAPTRKWISVREKPPKLESRHGFLAYFDNSEMRIVNEFQEFTVFRNVTNYYSEKELLEPAMLINTEIIDGELWRKYRMCGRTVKVKAPKIIYWMPLPEPPKKDECK